MTTPTCIPASAATVSPMIGSNRPPVRCSPPTNPAIRSSPVSRWAFRRSGGRERGCAVGGHSQPDRGPSALESAVHGGGCRVECLRDLGRGPLEDVAEHEDRPLTGRQELDGGHERQVDALTTEEPVRGISSAAVKPLVRYGIGPADVVDESYRRSWTSSIEQVETCVCRDPEEPRSEPRRVGQSLAFAPALDERLLDRVFGVVERSE